MTGCSRDQTDRLEVDVGLVGEVGNEGDRGGMRADVAQAERVAVRVGARDARGAGRATCAADVLDHELLAERPAKMSATMRPVMSAGPPAANGTITVPERVG